MFPHPPAIFLGKPTRRIRSGGLRLESSSFSFTRPIVSHSNTSGMHTRTLAPMQPRGLEGEKAIQICRQGKTYCWYSAFLESPEMVTWTYVRRLPAEIPPAVLPRGVLPRGVLLGGLLQAACRLNRPSGKV